MNKRKPCQAMALALGLLAASLLAMTSCGRDAIFFIISTEVPPQPPMIEGGPTQMVFFNWLSPLTMTGTALDDGEYPYLDNGNDTINYRPVIFVASGGLFWYTPEYRKANGEWDNTTTKWRADIGITQPDGRIIGIAATQRFLYALTGGGINNTIYRTNSSMDGRWEAVGRSNIQVIFADGERLFAGIRTGPGPVYGISSIRDNENELTLVVGGTRLLTGAVSDGTSYFLSTGRDSFRFDGTTAIPLRNATADPEDGEQPVFTGAIMGMIRLPDNSIIAVGRGGSLHRANGDSLALIQRTNAQGVPETNAQGDPIWMSTGRFATSALAIWEDSITGNRVLAVGVQGSLTTTTFNNGYVEFPLNDDGSLDTRATRHDADRLESVQGQNDQYRTSLGRLPINHLFQAPREISEDMTFFASTQTVGLWSFRDRDGVPQWNAEN